MATLSGAEALEYDAEVGSLATGKRADLAVIRLPEGDTRDPHQLLLDSDSHVVETWCKGQCVRTGS